MNDPAGRLLFAVDFARMDLDTARTGDWSNLRDDLRAFAGEQPLNSTIELPAGSRTASIDGGLKDPAIRKLQVEFRKVLEYVAGQKYRRTGPIPHCSIAVTKSPVVTAGEGVALLVAGKLRDLCLDALLSDLAQPGSIRPILRCPECDRLFYRVRKQKYCTSTCVRAANWRAYKDTKQGKAAKKRSGKNRRAKVKAAKRKRRA